MPMLADALPMLIFRAWATCGNSHSVSRMLLIPTETLRYERDCLSWELTTVTNYNDYVVFICFLAATPYHVILCNVRLLFYTIYILYIRVFS